MKTEEGTGIGYPVSVYSKCAQKMCNQMVMERALIFLLFNGEDGSRCGVRCGSWYQGSMCIVKRAAIWMDTILETTPSIHRIVIVRGAISSKTKVMFRTRI